MTAYIFVYIFLAIALAAMVYVIGMPWLTPKPRNIDPGKHGRRSRSHHGTRRT